MWNGGGGEAAWSLGVSLEVKYSSSFGMRVAGQPGWWSSGEGKREKWKERKWEDGGHGVLGGQGVSESYMSVVRNPANPPSPQFVTGLRKKVCLDCSADRYRTVLDGTTRPDHVVLTYAGSLRVRVEDALSSLTAWSGHIRVV